MKNRWSRVLALGLIAALAAALTPALTPAAASAAPADTAASSVQISKLKSIWGGGWVLNIGQTEGVLTAGQPAQLWFNRYHDWNNRWLVYGGESDGWWMYQNLYTGKCLTSPGIHDGAPVVQSYCNINGASQRWRLAGELGWNNNHMPLRNKLADTLNPAANLVLTQQTMNVGTLIIMSHWTGAQTQWWKSYSCGARLPDGTTVTPSSC